MPRPKHLRPLRTLITLWKHRKEIRAVNDQIKTLLTQLNGYKTYLGAAGMFGLALYQVSQGQYDQALQSFLAALTAAGLRHAVTKAGA